MELVLMEDVVEDVVEDIEPSLSGSEEIGCF
jgi:hypothetical protein